MLRSDPESQGLKILKVVSDVCHEKNSLVMYSLKFRFKFFKGRHSKYFMFKFIITLAICNSLDIINIFK